MTTTTNALIEEQRFDTSNNPKFIEKNYEIWQDVLDPDIIVLDVDDKENAIGKEVEKIFDFCKNKFIGTNGSSTGREQS